MSSLSTSISLALAAKLKLLFETSADKFLSFPVGLAFPTSFFSFMQNDGGLSAVDQHNHKVEFARITNMLPKDAAAFPQDATTLLWDVYGKVVADSIFAENTLTPTQNTQLEQAIDFLTDKQTIEGVELIVSSVAVQTYYQYKTIYDDINRQYLDEKLTVDLAANDEEGQYLRQVWTTTKEKNWLDRLKKAEDDWINLGQRDTVRNYQSLRADLEPKRSPRQFKTACQNDLTLGAVPDLNANGITSGYITFFSPNNAFQTTTPWLNLTLSKAEIGSLAAKAPAALSALFGNGQADDTIERLSFDCNKVVLVRPWLNTSLFSARSWKLPDDAVLSDGNKPRDGLLPAYTSSLIVVRNIRVTRRKTPASTGQPLIIPILSKTQVSKFVARYESPPVISKATTMVHKSALPKAQLLTTINKVHDPVQQEDAQVQKPVKNMLMQQAVYMRSTIRVPIMHAIPVKIATPEKVKKPAVNSTTVVLPPPVSKPQLIEEKFDFDGVVIVAFECTRLPKSPDPDLTLPWP